MYLTWRWKSHEFVNLNCLRPWRHVAVSFWWWIIQRHKVWLYERHAEVTMTLQGLTEHRTGPSLQCTTLSKIVYCPSKSVSFNVELDRCPPNLRWTDCAEWKPTQNTFRRI